MKILFFLSLLTLVTTALAHPVSYKGSIGVMGYHSPVLTHNQLNYSLSHRIAMGAHYFTRPELDNREASYLSANFLVHRWNGTGLQANIYAIAGAGYDQIASDNSSASGLTALQFDIENRKYYFLAKQLRTLGDDNQGLNQTLLRLGFAPYVGRFEDLHSWFIVEWKRNKFSDGFLLEDTTALLRFFYKNLLFEVGQSFNGFTKFNYIIHF